MIRAFGFEEFEADVSTRPEGNTFGSDEDWEMATAALIEALNSTGIPYHIAEGEGAFYGPKIDVHLRDAIGRRWQLSTLQVDFQEPQRFDLSYVGADNHPHRPIMIHRALFGSIERFFGILVEHYVGAFPVWLSPVQVRVLPVAADHEPYAFRIVDRLKAEGFRADIAEASDPLGQRIRRAKLEKVPYVLVVGNDDVAAGTVGVNAREQDVERGVHVDDFVERLRSDVVGRR
jgi:threonyl-tRNA synthetase